jgi:uncharacterized lipoprotein NlpE involved in copper resistance
MMLAGCGVAMPPSSRNASGATSSAMEFRGARPCADCSGIDAWLRLEHAGSRQRFRLIEAYRAGDRERRFEEEGEWRADGELLRLRASDGRERVYARLDDGSLQARDAHGRPLPAVADDVMMPVTFDTAH